MKKGFTLIELLVVISIIGIIIAVGTASYVTAMKQSRDSKRKTDLEQIRQALETYRSQNMTYPAESGAIPSSLSPNYISTIPTDPKSSTYSYWSNGSNYVVCTSLENSSLPANVSCAGLSCGGTCNYFVTRP